MEMILKGISYKKKLKDINLALVSGHITGLVGKDVDSLIDIINFDISDYKGKIKVDEGIKSIYISSLDNFFYMDTVKEEFKFIYKVLNIKKNNIRQEALEWFYKLDMDESLYDREVSTLSESEKYLIKIVIALSINTDIIIFKNIFNGLDLKYRKKIKELIQKLKKDKIIVINDSDINVIYDICDTVHILKNGKIVISGDNEKVYQNVKKLYDLKLEVPYLTDIVYKAKNKKGIKLMFRKDVRDVMKDIYRNV